MKPITRALLILLLSTPLAAEEAAQRHVELTEDQRRVVTSHITPARTAGAEEPSPSVAPGAAVPPSTRLYALPPAVRAQVPAVEGFRYFVARDRMVLVDPQNSRVVETLPIR
jgi:hypothetical protein